MGLLEYQAMPSLRDIAHDGVSCTFSNSRSAPDRDKYFCPFVRAGSMDRLSRTNHTLPGSLPPTSQAGRRVWASHLAFGLIAIGLPIVACGGGYSTDSVLTILPLRCQGLIVQYSCLDKAAYMWCNKMESDVKKSQVFPIRQKCNVTPVFF
jgi:hypothetical protein